MFDRGLSLDQAPPIDVIMRFYLTIPFFGILAAAAIFGADAKTLLQWESPQTVAIVHLLLMGIAGMAMIGALFQMLPVLAGATIKASRYHARWIHILFVSGILLLSAAFYFDLYSLMHPATLFLTGSLGFVVFLMLTKLMNVENKTSSVKGMIFSITSLGVGLVFALLLALVFMNMDVGLDLNLLRSVHLHFMLLGWIGLLVMAVAFQVIEMFYVTPPYPKTLTDFFPSAIFALLLVYTFGSLFIPALSFVADLLFALFFLVFAIVTLRRLVQRKRPVADATVWLWRTAMASLAASAIFAAAGAIAQSQQILSASALLFGYFVLSVIFAMSYKIVPFLVWFHLNAKGVLECPMMGDIIPAKRAIWHLWLHWAILAGGVLLLFSPYAWKFIAFTFAAESLLYGINLFRAMQIYQSLKEKGIL